MKKAINYIYFIYIFLFMMLGGHAWFMWFLEDKEHHRYMSLFLLLGAVVCYFYSRYNKIRLNRNKGTHIGLIILYVAMVSSSKLSLGSIVVNAIRVFPLWVILIDVEHSEAILRRTVNLFAFILVPGIILHFYMLRNGLLPGLPIVHPSSDVYLFLNYGFLLKGFGDYEDDGLRFQSILLEPGYLGTFIAFLLYSIRFDLKKFKMAWVLLIAQLLSFSLAGYILSIVGYLLCRWSNHKSIKAFAPLVLFAIIVILSAQTYNDGNNLINEKILERLQSDDEKGIAGNNRVGEGADFYFEQSLENGTFILGIGSDEIDKINGGEGWQDIKDYKNQIRGAGYKIFILRSGLVAAILYFAAYLYLGLRGRRKSRYSLGFFLIIFVTFLQAAYPNSYSWLIPFILGINYQMVNKSTLSHEHIISQRRQQRRRIDPSLA